MKILLSPAKKMRTIAISPSIDADWPLLQIDADKLVGEIRELSLDELAKVLGVSGTTLHQAVRMYHEFGVDQGAATPALFTYSGTAYAALDALTFDSADIDFVCRHLRIFSGLYGIVRPQDKLYPYRLDVANRLKLDDFRNLYNFWRPKVNGYLRQEGENELIYNLASEEYFKLIDTEYFPDNAILTLSFKEFKNGVLKSVSPAVKKARGLMARFIITNRITDRESVKDFSEDSYLYSPDHSTENEYVFIRQIK